jgi:hypothetical protein
VRICEQNAKDNLKSKKEFLENRFNSYLAEKFDIFLCFVMCGFQDEFSLMLGFKCFLNFTTNLSAFRRRLMEICFCVLLEPTRVLEWRHLGWENYLLRLIFLSDSRKILEWKLRKLVGKKCGENNNWIFHSSVKSRGWTTGIHHPNVKFSIYNQLKIPFR